MHCCVRICCGSIRLRNPPKLILTILQANPEQIDTLLSYAQLLREVGHPPTCLCVVCGLHVLWVIVCSAPQDYWFSLVYFDSSLKLIALCTL
jgi:hypothetical protein